MASTRTACAADAAWPRAWGPDRVESCLYFGEVRHHRREPRPHAFRYRLYMSYLDLGELDRVFAGRWLWSVEGRGLSVFRRGDHYGDQALPLDECVRRSVEEQAGYRPAGPIRLLTHLRSFGHCFNPISLFYCFAPDGARVEAVLAEVTNTPWNERHVYVLPASDGGGSTLAFECDKEFHVSPFLDMDFRYRWRVSRPGPEVRVAIVNLREGRPCFDASLRLERREISTRSLAAALLRYPFVGARVLAAIYWQALQLRRKGIPQFPHPGERTDQEGSA